MEEKERIRIAVSSAFGLESVAARELKDLGHRELLVENGRISFAGTFADIAQLNTSLRTVERVWWEIARFPAKTADDLFEQTRAVSWPDIIPEKGGFPVRARVVRSVLKSGPSCQKTVKKAIAESMARRYGAKRFEESGAPYAVELSLQKDEATLSIDSSGDALHKRGYRPAGGEAPLKETLAAAIVLLSKWDGTSSFMDPFCGSGTIAIEAAMIARGISPGMQRRFVSEAWPQLPEVLWKEVRREARKLKTKIRGLEIRGSDKDARMLELARRNAERAGLGADIRFEQRRFEDLEPAEACTIVTNPPYGERIGERSEIESIYAAFRKFFRNDTKCSFHVLTADSSFENLVHRRSSRKRKLYNGRLRVDLYSFDMPSKENRGV